MFTKDLILNSVAEAYKKMSKDMMDFHDEAYGKVYTVKKEDANEFIAKAAAAKKAGQSSFKFGDKTYPVTIKIDPDKILEAEKAMKDASSKKAKVTVNPTDDDLRESESVVNEALKVDPRKIAHFDKQDIVGGKSLFESVNEVGNLKMSSSQMKQLHNAYKDLSNDAINRMMKNVVKREKFYSLIKKFDRPSLEKLVKMDKNAPFSKAVQAYLDGKIKESVVNEAKSYSNKFASWFTGTVLYNVKHPKFGKHKVTPEQIKNSSGDYKSKLFKNIEQAVKRGDITPDMIKQNESVNEAVVNEMNDMEMVADQLVNNVEDGMMSKNEFADLLSQETKFDKKSLGKVYDEYLDLDPRSRMKLSRTRDMMKFLKARGLKEEVVNEGNVKLPSSAKKFWNTPPEKLIKTRGNLSYHSIPASQWNTHPTIIDEYGEDFGAYLFEDFIRENLDLKGHLNPKLAKMIGLPTNTSIIDYLNDGGSGLNRNKNFKKYGNWFSALNDIYEEMEKRFGRVKVESVVNEDPRISAILQGKKIKRMYKELD